MKTYITFGSAHVHKVNGVVFDQNCVCAIEAEDYFAGRRKAFEVFGRVWAFAYSSIEHVHLEYYSRGIIELEDVMV